MRDFLRRYRWLLLAGAWVGVAALTFIGYQEHYRLTGQSRTALDILYSIQKPFKMGVTESPACWQLELARWLGALVTLSTVCMGVFVAFRAKIILFFLRHGRGGHAVFCGLDRISLKLAGEYRAAGTTLVFIEPDEHHPLATTARTLGAVIVTGDPRQETNLRTAAVAKASTVYITGPDDGAVVEIVANLFDVVTAAPGPPLTCHTQVVDLTLFGLLKRHRMFTEPHPRFDLRIFNGTVNSARVALAHSPLDRFRIWAGDDRTVHLVIAGFGQMGEALAVQAARIGHFANGRPMQIDVIDLHAGSHRESFFGRYPRFADVAAITFHQADIEGNDATRLFDLWATDRRLITTVAICFDQDTRAIITALHRADATGPETPILVRIAEERGIASLLGRFAENRSRLIPFGMDDRDVCRAVIEGGGLDRLARAIHEEYLHDALAQGLAIGSKPALVPWERLDRFYRDSNRQQADHLAVKVRAIGAALVPQAEAAGREPFSLWPEEVEVLARMEHRRWCAHYLLAGYRHGPRDDAARTHPDLVPWEQLSEAVRDYDRQPVRRLAQMAALAGLAIVRVR